MIKHEEKHCPRCSMLFECKAGTIMQCQCSEILLSAEERIYIEHRYEDCLCIHCLRIMQQAFLVFKEKQLFKQ